MSNVYELLQLILFVVKWIILAHFIMSWLINFQVLNLRQPVVSQVWDLLNRLLQPIYGQVRRVLPVMAGLDLAPLVVILAIYALRIVLVNNIAAFY